MAAEPVKTEAERDDSVPWLHDLHRICTEGASTFLNSFYVLRVILNLTTTPSLKKKILQRIDEAHEML